MLYLFFNDNGEFDLSNEQPTESELKILHKTIKKVNEDIERFAFNTAVSAFMICTNELMVLKCNKRSVLKELVLLIAPFAPHLAEELWQHLGNNTSITTEPYPFWNEDHIKEETITYPVAINGKVRANIDLPVDINRDDVEKEVLEMEKLKKWIEGKQPKKFIFVEGKMINVVV